MATEQSTARALFDQLREEGEALLERWRDEKRQEGVHLECKRATVNQQRGMTRSDLEQMAKTVSAFANSEGGVLIFGVDAREIKGIDAIQGLAPIPDIAAFTHSAERARADLLSPSHAGIEMIALPAREVAGAGYLAVRVDRSDKRPHRSLKDNAYYRRSGDRTSVMEHSDLKDAMSRMVRPELRIGIEIADVFPEDHSSIQFSNAFNILVAITIENTGGAMARFPFLHFETSPGGGIYHPSSGRKGPAWPRLINEDREYRLQGGNDDVIPIATKVRVAYAVWTYKRDTTTVGGMPLAMAIMGIGGRFGCDGAPTQGFETVFRMPDIFAELQRRQVPTTAQPTWPG